jgi:hypothetical protein
VVVSENVPVNLHSERGVRMAVLPLGNFHPGCLEKHARQCMTESVEPHPASVVGNTELVQNWMENLLHDPAPVKWAAQLVRKKQLVSVSDEMRMELRFTIGVIGIEFSDSGVLTV